MPGKTAPAHFDRSLPLFLGELEQHNERRWFEAHRDEYESALDEPSLGPALGDYQPYHAARADLLRRAGRSAEARDAYSRAIALSGNDSERGFLERRRDQLARGG